MGFREVTLKGGMPPPNPERYAPYTLAINLIGGGVIVFVIPGIVTGSMDFDTWTASAGATIWMKFFLDFALGRHAHLESCRGARRSTRPALRRSTVKPRRMHDGLAGRL